MRMVCCGVYCGSHLKKGMVKTGLTPRPIVVFLVHEVQIKSEHVPIKYI